jgi:hypothetical protein
LAIGRVILTQLLAQPSGLDAYDRIDGGVEGFRTVEDLQGDVVR